VTGPFTVHFSLSNPCSEVEFNQSASIASPPAGARFGTTTFVSGDESNDVEIANLEGPAGSTITVEMTQYDNTNSNGYIQVNTGSAFPGNQWQVVLDSSGKGSLDVVIHGDAGSTNTIIRGIFKIVGVSSGSIGSPDTFQTSKVF
jgi:hypothetical protein